MSTSTAVGKAASADLPAMQAPSGMDGIDFSDLAMPRVYFLQGTSQLVKEGVAKEGQVVMASSSDDPSPTFLIEDHATDSFVAYIIGVEKKAGFYEPDGIRYTDDLTIDRSNPEHHDKWHIYDYTVAIPEHEGLLPVRMRMQRTAGKAAAKKINAIAFAAGGYGTPVPVVVTFGKKTGSRGHVYWAPQIGPASATPTGLAVATQIADRAAAMNAARRSENYAPEATVDQPDF